MTIKENAKAIRDAFRQEYEVIYNSADTWSEVKDAMNYKYVDFDLKFKSVKAYNIYNKVFLEYLDNQHKAYDKGLITSEEYKEAVIVNDLANYYVWKEFRSLLGIKIDGWYVNAFIDTPEEQAYFYKLEHSIDGVIYGINGDIIKTQNIEELAYLYKLEHGLVKDKEIKDEEIEL